VGQEGQLLALHVVGSCSCCRVRIQRPPQRVPPQPATAPAGRSVRGASAPLEPLQPQLQLPFLLRSGLRLQACQSPGTDLLPAPWASEARLAL